MQKVCGKYVVARGQRLLQTLFTLRDQGRNRVKILGRYPCIRGYQKIILTPGDTMKGKIIGTSPGEGAGEPLKKPLRITAESEFGSVLALVERCNP